MSHIKELIGKASWILTALGSLNWGLKPLGLDLFNIDFIKSALGAIENPFYYLIGLAGAYSLVSFFTGCCEGCDK